MLPAPWRFIWGITAFEQRNGPRRLTRMIRSQTSASISYTGATLPKVAALFTRTSIRPNCSRVVSAIRSVSCSSLQSATIVIASPPASPIFSTVSAAVCGFTSTTATRAPSAANRNATDSPKP